MRFISITPLAFLLFLPLRFTYASSADTTCGIAWGPIVNISGPNPNAYNPRIAAQGETLHVTWTGGGFRLAYSRSTNDGASWSPPREMLTDSMAFPNEANDPWVIANRHTVFLIFTFSVMTGKPHMMKSTDRGDTWSTPVPLIESERGTRIWHATISGDTLLVAYPRYGPRIARSTNAGDSWDTSLAVVRQPVELASGILHSSFPAGFDVVHKRSFDLGNTWQDSTALSSTDNEYSDYPALGIVRSDPPKVLVTWRDSKYGCLTLVGCSIFLSQSTDNGNTWAPETLLTEQPDGYNNDRTGQQISSLGNTVAIVWMNDLTRGANLRFSSDGGSCWSPLCDPAPVRRTTALVSLVTPSTLHIAWTDADNGCPACFGIYYRHGVILSTSVQEPIAEVPLSAQLDQNYPNPFNPSTTIRYSVPIRGLVNIRVFDLLGREMTVLVNEQREAGEHVVEWNASGVASGVYTYRLSVTDAALRSTWRTRTMLLVK